jgi:hypothetical protein
MVVAGVAFRIVPVGPFARVALIDTLVFLAPFSPDRAGAALRAQAQAHI